MLLRTTKFVPGLVHSAIRAEDFHFGCGGMCTEAAPQIITAAAGSTIKLLIRLNNPRLLCLVSGKNSQKPVWSAQARCRAGRLECPARPGGDGAGPEQPGGAVAGGGREREPRVTVYERQPPEHRGGGREERRLLAARRERGLRAEPDQRELGEPDRQPVTGVDRRQVAAQLLNRLAGREVATVPVHRDEVDPQ